MARAKKESKNQRRGDDCSDEKKIGSNQILNQGVEKITERDMVVRVW
jgi:hypothetical protein